MLLMTGCGRFGFDPLHDLSGTSSNDGHLTDGGVDPDGIGDNMDGPPGGVDAPVMGSCASYSAIAGGQSGSTYRVITSAATFWAHHADCNDDNPGSTHLVALETATEGDAVIAIAGGVSFYAGAVQSAGQADPTDGWRWFTGGPMMFGWAANEGSDGADDVEDGEEQLFMVAPTRHAIDVTGTAPARAVCECDGRAISGSIVIPPEP